MCLKVRDLLRRKRIGRLRFLKSRGFNPIRISRLKSSFVKDFLGLPQLHIPLNTNFLFGIFAPGWKHPYLKVKNPGWHHQFLIHVSQVSWNWISCYKQCRMLAYNKFHIVRIFLHEITLNASVLTQSYLASALFKINDPSK